MFSLTSFIFIRMQRRGKRQKGGREKYVTYRLTRCLNSSGLLTVTSLAEDFSPMETRLSVSALAGFSSRNPDSEEGVSGFFFVKRGHWSCIFFSSTALLFQKDQIPCTTETNSVTLIMSHISQTTTASQNNERITRKQHNKTTKSQNSSSIA